MAEFQPHPNSEANLYSWSSDFQRPIATVTEPSNILLFIAIITYRIIRTSVIVFTKLLWFHPHPKLLKGKWKFFQCCTPSSKVIWNFLTCPQQHTFIWQRDYIKLMGGILFKSLSTSPQLTDPLCSAFFKMTICKSKETAICLSVAICRSLKVQHPFESSTQSELLNCL